MSEERSAERSNLRTNLVARRYIVRGRVQGVGFRWWTQREACAMRLLGSVHNRADGAVELVVSGHADTVDRFEARLAEGPPAARVDAVEGDDIAPESVRFSEPFQIVSAP